MFSTSEDAIPAILKENGLCYWHKKTCSRRLYLSPDALVGVWTTYEPSFKQEVGLISRLFPWSFIAVEDIDYYRFINKREDASKLVMSLFTGNHQMRGFYTDMQGETPPWKYYLFFTDEQDAVYARLTIG